jgi:hypothetical protein
MQRGGVVAGVWLVGLGAVLLVQQALDVPWRQAWPLFLVFAGVGTGVSALVGLGRAGPWSVVWALVGPLILVSVGLLLFLDFSGLADLDALELLGRWWPVALIGIGLFILVGAVWPRGRAVTDRLEIPIGDVTAGEVLLKFGAGRLAIRPGPAGHLVSGTFEGGVRRRDLGPGRVELEADISAVWPFGDRFHWQVGLAPDLPLTLRVEGGAASSDLDLAGLRVTSLEVKTGASDTGIVLPAGVERCRVRIEAGAAQVRIRVPDGVAASIRSRMGLGSTSVDESRFPRSGDRWTSPEYEAAAHRVEIDVSGGVGSVRID